jgi:hypothetical protein
MKIKNLNDKIKPLTGEDDPKAADAMPTYKRVLLLCVGNIAADNAQETESCFRLVNQIKAADDKLELDDSDAAVLRAVLGRNPLRLPVAIMGPVLEKLNDAEK